MAHIATEEFQSEVRACAEEIREWLPALADRHSPLIVLAALTEHVGGGLRLCQEAGACTPADVRTVLVAGRVVKRDGVLVDVDLAELLHRGDRSAEQVLARVPTPLPGTPEGGFKALGPLSS